MESLSRYLKSPYFKAALIGAFGGMAPKLVELVPKLFHNDFPTGGYYFGLSLLALFGMIGVAVFRERDLRKALTLGAGAPALIAGIAATAVAPADTALLHQVDFTLQARAYAQSSMPTALLKLVVNRNESPNQLNSFWIRADNVTIHRYWTKGDTILVRVPSGTRNLRIDFPSQTEGVILPMSEIDWTRPINLQVTSQKSTKEFWQTFGGANVKAYQVQRKK
jgi:hypothetical protein